jgi:transcriptional regulator with XRE-family HTH domain
MFAAMRARMATSLADRIKKLRLSIGEKQDEFADRLGVSQATVARWEGGSTPKPDALHALAELADLSVEEFLGKPARVPADLGEIQVVGYVGAGAAVYAYDDEPHGGGFGSVERPPFVRGKAVAVEIKGDSLYPVAEDGWRLIYAGEQTMLESEVLNRLCVVKLLDGRVLVKRILKGSSPQRYHLVSNNAPMLEDVEVEWAAPVKAIIPS